MEFLGNILDNAKQWAKSRVGIDILQQDGNVVVTISGDGPGRPEEKLRIPPRGLRLDQTTNGFGFGLVISRDIIEAYHGSLTLMRATIGGARGLGPFAPTNW
jgi:C4-dicarboxylate-specific signal transduction histidine kinase